MEKKIIEESRMKFVFSETKNVIKFDDTSFYRKYFNQLPEAKGVDFVSVDKNGIAFIEIKNCTEDEPNCWWRIIPNNKKRDASHTTVDIKGRDSLDIEIPQKVAMTIAALIGAKSFKGKKECIEELMPFINYMSSKELVNDKKKKYVILFLEGNFNRKTQSKKMIMKNLQDSINKKLKWLDCRVSVVDSTTYNSQIFQVLK